jgi:hypothetical protein
VGGADVTTNTVLQAAAMAMAGDCCCGLFNQNGECCMSDRARELFAAIAKVGGPTLEQCEAVARGDAKVIICENNLKNFRE